MITTVNPKGQGTIPEPLRDRYGFAPGTKVVWAGVRRRPHPQPLLSVEQLRGRFKAGELTAMLLEERARDRTHADGRSRWLIAQAPDPVLTGDHEVRWRRRRGDVPPARASGAR